jgi:dipeptide/tripeptide permease
MSTNLVNYLQDRFGQGNATAANNVTTWSGTCYLTPLLGAFLADAYFGRYWTIASFSCIYVIVSSFRNSFLLMSMLLTNILNFILRFSVHILMSEVPSQRGSILLSL